MTLLARIMNIQQITFIGCIMDELAILQNERSIKPVSKN